MKTEVKVPSMGESITEAVVGAILKAAGEPVAVDDELLELETDKVNQILYAPAAGVISWDIKPDDVVTIGQVLGYVDSSGAAATPSPVKKSAEKASQEEKKAEAPSESTQKSTKEEKQAPVKQETITEARLSKESFVAELTAPKKETETHQTPPTQAPPPKTAADSQPVAVSTERQEERKPMSKIRKVIASRLVEVKQQTAMLTTFNEVDMSAVMELRGRYKETFNKHYNARLGFMSFFIKATVSALNAFPEVNATIDGTDIIYRNFVDIGVAVGTEKGLFVPIIRNAGKLSFAGIESTIEGFAKKARDGKLTADDLQGGTFTITNGGVYGSLLSTPILNPPQSAILGMHKIMKRAVVIDDEIVIRPMMYLALSYDHRIIDGKEAVSFLVHIKNNLEDPSRLLLEI